MTPQYAYPTAAFLDIETTGLNPFWHDVLEVAYVREFANGDTRETHFSLDFDMERADEDALKINRYYSRKAELAAIKIQPASAAQRMLVELQDCIIVGANPAFDATFLRYFIWKNRMAEPTWHYRLIDLNTLGTGWCKMPNIMRTGELAEEFGVPIPEEYHTALVDARWNREVYHAILDD